MEVLARNPLDFRVETGILRGSGKNLILAKCAVWKLSVSVSINPIGLLIPGEDHLALPRADPLDPDFLPGLFIAGRAVFCNRQDEIYNHIPFRCSPANRH